MATAKIEINRRGLDRTDVNSRIQDAMIRHRHYLLGVENGVIRDMVAPLQTALSEIEAKLAALAAKERTVNVAFRINRLEQMHTEISLLVSAGQAESMTIFKDRLREVIRKEDAAQGSILRRMVPNGIPMDMVSIDPARIETMLTTPLGGKRWEERMRTSLGEMNAQIQRDLTISTTLGEGAQGAARRIRKSVTAIGVHRSVLIARTEIQRVANDTALGYYEKNKHLIQGVQAVETLDDRTCLVCAELDGKTWDLNDRSRPTWPIHPGCRGILVGMVRGADELGITQDMMPQASRQSLSGSVPETTDYKTWFDNQPAQFQRDWLGAARYERFQSGMPIDQMVKDGRILNVSALPEAA